jgi:hypothetical protein
LRIAAMKGDESSKGCNWREYNESLVKRGKLYDLEELNRGKLGRMFAFPWFLSSF